MVGDNEWKGGGRPEQGKARPGEASIAVKQNRKSIFTWRGRSSVRFPFQLPGVTC